MSETTLLSNTQIKKLGDRIRSNKCNKNICSPEDLVHLQNFRMSFKDSLNEIFQILSEESKHVHKNRIVSFRMKKIDTIISKLNRENGMDLERMGDIAGCRCIVQSESAIYKIVDRLKQNYTLKINDKIAIPDEDGYKALHIYVKSKNCSLNRTVEIQLRTVEQHYWSTLVEIIDVIYDTTIKTGDNSIPELVEFLELYSEKDKLSLDKKIRLINLENNHKIYNSLNETFRHNLIKIRMKWHDLDAYTNDTYLLFDVNQDTKEASFSLFDTYIDAEANYFEKFKNTNGDLLVAHLNISKFNQLAIAYSNYVLSNHDFLDSWLNFCTTTANELIDTLKLSDLFTVAASIREMLENIENVIDSDSLEIDEQFEQKQINVNQLLKLNVWLEEREKSHKKRIDKFNELQNRLEHKITDLLKTQNKPLKKLIRRINPFKKFFF